MDVIIDRHNNVLDINMICTNSGDEYEIGEYINRGGNAVVYECVNRLGDVYAVKFLMQGSAKLRKRFEQEISVLKSINNEHWIKYIGDGEIEKTFNKSIIKIRFVIMEKADSNLLDLIKQPEFIEYEKYAPQFRGLANALAELHKIGIHRDIKPENILIKGEKWMLSDLGLCSVLDEGSHLDLTSDKEKIGPKYWFSPEAMNKIYFEDSVIDKSSDVYQLCAVFWFAVTKKHPTGILERKDWGDNNINIYNVIYKSLLHNALLRPKDGQNLYELLKEATINE